MAEPLEVSLATGTQVGVYEAFAENMEEMLSVKGIDLDLIPTMGAAANIDSMYLYNIPLALSQVDVLAYMNSFGNENPLVQGIAEDLKLLLPLYEEEIYVIAREEITEFSQLENAVIAVGPAGSGTAMTAKVLLLDAGIIPGELRNLSTLESIAALRSGVIDAFFYVVGTPAPLLEEEIFPEDNFILLPVAIRSVPDDEFFNQFYQPSVIPAGAYPWLGEDVETLSVQAALWTTANADCEVVGEVTHQVIQNLRWLQANGHPEWQSVSFEASDFAAYESQLSPCVEDQL
jgi:hypothetical protein